jgi:hypothetical protein
VASAVALSGRGTARAADALTIGPNGVNIDNLQVAKNISFTNHTGELLTLWSPEYSVGIQPYTLYARSYKNFAWYKGGKHTDTELDPGGGTKMMSLSDGSLTVSDKFTAEGDATFKKSLTVEGDATLQQSLTVSGDATLKKSLTVSGPMKIDGNNALELGAGVSGKEVNAGQIAYQKHSTDALDIVGAGTTSGSRKIKCWAEGGATLYGSLSVSGNVSIANNLYVPGGVETLRMVRGAINGAGVTVAGEGFSVRRIDTGLYEIGFTTAFSSVPAASATQIFPEISPNPGNTNATGSTAGGDFANIAYLSPDRMRVKTWPNDRAFSFIVIGPR